MNRYIIAISVLMLLSCSNKDGQSQASSYEGNASGGTPPMAVEVLEVQPGKLIPFLELSGTVRGVNEVSLFSRNFGNIEEVYVSLGDYVNEGDLLLIMDDSLSLLNLKAAEESRNTARIEFEALEQSYNQGGTSRRDYSAARNRLASSEAALEQARQNHEGNSITSPISGYIAAMDRNISRGNSLTQGQLVAYIIDDSAWIMEGYLGESRVGLVHPGDEVQVLIPSAGNRWEQGVIQAVAAGGDLTTGSYKVVIQWISDNSSLRSGMTAQVKIPTNGENQGLLIPASALVKREGSDFVFLAEEGVAQPVEVSPGKALGNRLLIEEGLTEGDLLIISGLDTLSPQRELIMVQADREEALE